MRGWPVFVLVVLGGCFGTCVPSEAVWQRVEFPGFSIEAPDYVQAKPGLAYREDDIEAQRGLSAVSISWNVGEISDAADFGARVNAVMKELAKGERVEMQNARSTMVGGQKAVRIDGKVDILHVTIVDIACGSRTITIQFTGPGIDDLRDRVLASFKCKPDPAQEKTNEVAPVPVGVDDPKHLAGFRYTDEDRTVLSITDDKLVGVFQGAVNMSDDAELLRKLLPKFLDIEAGDYVPDASRLEKRKRPNGVERTFETGLVRVDDKRMLVVSSIWVCDEKQSVVAFAIAVSDDMKHTALVDWLDKFRCAEPGDPPLALAPATK